MKPRRHLLVGAVLILAAVRLGPPAASTLPASLTDREFWSLSAELSEPGGTFRSENLLSNERMMQHVIPELVGRIRPGTVYLGVGPEQNFTYIAALKPSMAFVIDIRRGNLQLHMLYKALFELAADRSEFVSKLFSRPQPPELSRSATAGEIFSAYTRTEASAAAFTANSTAVREHLTKTRSLPLSPDDLVGLQWIYQSFYAEGPLIQYSATFGRSATFPTYAELMTATDAAGVSRSFLASEEAFSVVKGLHHRNLIVPVVGDFAGDKALGAVGRYLKERQVTIGAFYLSNVEQYLGREGRWPSFCENVARLPLDRNSSFIRSVRDAGSGPGFGLSSVTGNILAEVEACPASR